MEKNPPAARSPRPLIGLKRHGRIGALIALVLVLAGIPIVWVKGQSRYTAEAIFQVAPSYQKNLSADKELELQSNSQYREFVNHLSRSLLRYDVLERALKVLAEQGVDAKLPSENERKCIERLQRTLAIYPVADTYMVRVGLQSDDKTHLHAIVNAVVNAFLETTRSEQIYGSDARSRVLAERVTLARSEISQLEGERTVLAGVLGLTTFGENTVNPFDAILAQAREKSTTASIERVQAQATLDAFSAQKEIPASSGRSVLEMRLQDDGLQAMRNEVIKRSQELKRTVSGLHDNHPAKSPAVAEDAEINRRLQASEGAFEQSAQSNVRLRLVASLQQTQQVERNLEQRVRGLQGQASTFAGNFREAMRTTGEIKKREQELTDLRNRVNYLQTESNALGFVRLITPALPAETPHGPGKTKMLLALLLAAAALGLALPVLIDFLDARILTVGDAERAMGIASAAWMVDRHDVPSRVVARDQLRRFASTLNRNRSRGTGGVFAFSSVKADGQSAQLILGVAHTLQELGTRVLVVDANSMAHASPLHDERVGLTELLSGLATAEDVIHAQRSGQNDQLAFVPFGQARATGIQRLDVLRAAIDQWLTRYELILIDIPPILPSADAELLIDAIGQVFLVVEAEAVTKAEVARARMQLEKMGPEAVGLIVNKLTMESSGSDTRARVVENLTGRKFQSFMTKPAIGLQLQLLRLHWARWWQLSAPGHGKLETSHGNQACATVLKSPPWVAFTKEK